MKFNKLKGKTSGNKPNSHQFKNNKSKHKLNPEKPKQAAGEDEEIKQLQARYASIDPKNITLFSDLPLSKKTLKGLKKSNYIQPTAIQKDAIGYALQGKDVLGAAITGSGKTLAFLIPVLENLYQKKWSRPDGVGAIIITPTRELAYQIFETLKKIGAAHDFSAGLIIGGKNLKFEKSRMDQCNIVICTPGRLLHHMDQNQVFNCSTMQILVLDEADRCLDMGFEQAMNAIIEHLPPERQTFLYSATQTRSVKDLARLSLSDPVFVAPHDQAAFSTPDALAQNYVVVNLEDKITMLWSFIKTHMKQKCIVFLSSCKQVKYVNEMFCKLRPGSSLLALYGTLHQDRRMAIYNEFCRKSNVVLFATDVASRGLDFPEVNWVVQLDCPEDATAYIHRAGRTARNKKHGENLLVLLPSEEEAMVAELQERKIPINKISIDPRRLFSPRAKMEGFLAQNRELKESAQRAFVAYIKSVVLMKNKKIFNVNALDTDAFALSLGLVVVPRIRFLQRMKKHQDKNRTKQLREKEGNSGSDEDNCEIESDNDGNEADEKKKSDDDDESAMPSTSKPTANFDMSSDDSDSDSDTNTFMRIKRRDHEILEDSLPEVPSLESEKTRNKKPLTKAALAKRVIKKKIMANKKVVFDEEGTEHVDTAKQLQSDLGKEYDDDEEGGINIERAKTLLREEDKFDKARFKLMVKAKHKEAKTKSNMSGEQEQFDEFGSDDESEGPDMSWLPDPDKIYKKNSVARSDDDDDDDNYNVQRQVVNSSDTSDDDDEPTVHVPGKLVKAKKKNSQVQTDEEMSEDEAPPPMKKAKKLTAKLSVNEAEMLAMRLLGGGL